jgi:deferrochelatase/peroxidase EfeB
MSAVKPVVLGPGSLSTVKSEGGYAFDTGKLEQLRGALHADLQANILRGNERLRANFIFVRFSSQRRAVRQLIGALLEGFAVGPPEARTLLRITRFGGEARAPEDREPRPPIVNLLFTAAGYQALGHEPGSLFAPGFCKGPRAPEAVRRLHDPEPIDWEPAHREPWDALVILSHDHESVLEGATAALVQHLGLTGVIGGRGAGGPRAEPDLHIERGNMLDRDGRPSGDPHENFEIFGFRDGISQPVFLVEDWTRVKELQYGGQEPRPGADPRLPLSLVLAKDPLGSTFCEHHDARTSFGLGSFFVFRKLEQDYRGFEVRKELYKADVRHRREFLQELYASKHASTPGANPADVANPYAEEKTRHEEEFVLTSLVGRSRDGEPNAGPFAGDRGGRFNDFDYQDDPEGAVCPFSAHIRKANPRGATGDLDKERERRIVRRGLPYGTRDGQPRHHLKPEAGLLFFCAQSDIERQFEHIQSVWLNGYSDRSSLPTPGIDSLVGQMEPKGSEERRAKAYASPFGRREGSRLVARREEQRDRSSRHGWINQTVRMEFDFQDYVELKGAEYLFAPSISGLVRMATSPESE